MSGLFHQEWWITQRFLTRVQFIYPVDRARDHWRQLMPRNYQMWHSEIPEGPRETEGNLQTWNFDPIPQRVSIGRTRRYKDKQYMQRMGEFKYDAQPEQKHHFIAKEFIKKIKIHKSYVVMILKKLNWPILILHNWQGSIQRHHRKSRD